MNRVLLKVTSLILVIAVLLGQVTAVFAAEKTMFSDFPTGWSAQAVEHAVDNGILTGMGDGTIRPGNLLTRAQMAAIINRAFGATVKADISSYTDVPRDAWYYNDIAVAVNMGTFEGTGSGKMNPDRPITREEAFAVLSRALVLDGYASAMSEFADGGDTSEWAKPEVGALTGNRYVNGYPDGTVRPLKNITREEFAQVMYNIFKTYLDKSIADFSAANCLVVRKGNVTLRNVRVEGDLILGDGVGAGDIRLENVEIGGRLLCRGGEGLVSIVGNTSTDHGVVVKDVNGVVNFNNYKAEAIFEGVREITRATYLSDVIISTGRPSYSGGSGSAPSVSKYTVTFYTDSTFSVKAKTITVYEGDNVGSMLPAAPIREGYKFEGWYYMKNNSQIPFSNMMKIDKDYKVFAVWSKLGTSVPVYMDESKTQLIETIVVSDGEDVIGLLPDAPEREGYDFDGWYYKGTDGNEKKVEEGIKAFEGMEVYGKWTDASVPSYKVTFYRDESKETVYHTANIAEGSPVTLPEDPEMTGFDFDGWYYKDASGAEKKLDDSYRVTAALDLYAKWSIKSFEVKFYAKSGDSEPVKTVTVEYNQTVVELPSAPTLAGYDFAGWYYIADGVEAEFKADTVITDNVNVYAKWNGLVDVKFYKESDLKVLVDSKQVVSGEKLSELPSCAKEGHTLAGWYYKDGGVEKEFTTDVVVTENLDVYAKWTVNSYTIGFYKEKTDEAPFKTEKVNYGGTVTIPEAPTKEGYTFVGWFYEKNGQEYQLDGNTIIQGDIKAYSKWTVNEYTVSFDAKNGVVTPVKVKYGESVGSKMPADPTNGNKIFLGWFYTEGAAEKEFSPDQKITGNMTVFAKWQEPAPEIFTVKFYKEKTDSTSYATRTAEAGKTVSLPAAPTKTGHRFIGWVYGTNDAAFDANTKVNGNLNVYAKWEKESYSVKIDPRNGDEPTEINVRYGEGAGSQMPSDPRLEGHDFGGWFYKDEAGSDIPFTKDTPIEGPVDVFAKWNVKSYSVSFYKNENDTAAIKTVSVEYNKTVPGGDMPEAPDNPGKVFEGWFYKDASGQEAGFTNDTYIKGDTKVYAKWSDADYTVSFYKEKTDTEVYRQAGASYGGTVTLPAIPEKEGFRFVGWVYGDDDAAFDENTKVYGDTKVYATWTLNEYTVTFDAKDGTAPVTVKVEHGKGVGDKMPANPEKEGHEFAGWFYKDEAGENVPFDKDTPVTGEMDIFAEWEAKEYTVTFDPRNGDAVTEILVEYGMTVGGRMPANPVNGTSEFLGWFYNNGGTEAEFTADIEVKADIDVYAKWKGLLDVRFYKLEGDADFITIVQVKEGGCVTELPAAPERENYEFLGWYTLDASGSKVIFDETVKISESINVYADWKLMEYTVRYFDEYTPTGDIDCLNSEETVEHGGKAAAIPESFAEDGYVKDSSVHPVYTEEYVHSVEADWWYVDKDGEWAVFDDSVVVDRDIDVYMMFKNISFNFGGDRLGYTVAFSAHYNDDERIIDTAKDIMYSGRNSVQFGVDKFDLDRKILEKMSSLPVKLVDSDGNVLNQTIDMEIVDIIEIEEIKAQIALYIESAISSGGAELDTVIRWVGTEGMIDVLDIPDAAAEYIRNNPDEAADKIKEFYDSMTSDEKAGLDGAIADRLESNPYFVSFIDAMQNSDEGITVTPENIVLLRGVSYGVRSYSYDTISEKLYNKGLGTIIDIIGEDIVREYFADAQSRYCDGIDELCLKLEADESGEYSYPTYLTFIANIMEDFVVPKYDAAMNKIEKKLADSGKGDYNNNIHLKALVELDMIDELFEIAPADGDIMKSGYKVRDIMAYYDFMYAMVLLSDDAIMYYGDIDYDTAVDKVAPYAVNMLNKLLGILNDFDEDGSLPGGLDDKLSGVEQIKGVYESFEGFLNVVVDVILESEANREYTEADFRSDMIVVACDLLNRAIIALDDYAADGVVPPAVQELLDRSEKIKNIFENNKGNIDKIAKELADIKFTHVHTEEEVAAYEEYIRQIYTLIDGSADPVFTVDSMYDIIDALFGDVLEKLKYDPELSEDYVLIDAYMASVKGMFGSALRFYN